MLYVLDLLGTLVFAISGALQANRHELDYLGFMVLAVATGVGGGIVRDVLLGVTPPAVFQDEVYLVVCIVGGAVVYWAAPPIAKRWNRVMIADTIGLGVFAAMGAAKGAEYGLGPIGVVMIAAITATGGGVIRDLLVREVPAVIKGGFYATAALLGGGAYLLAQYAGLSEPVQLTAAILTTTGLRAWAVYKKVSMPLAQPVDDLTS